MDGEQHLPYRATGDVVILDGDGSRWVRERTCHVVRHKLGWHHGHVWLSCGHDGGWTEVGVPLHCPACGARVIEGREGEI